MEPVQLMRLMSVEDFIVANHGWGSRLEMKQCRRELVRVVRLGNTIVTAEREELQARGNRPYFQEAVRLQPGEVYVSEITLDCEWARVVEPCATVMRAAACTPSRRGLRRSRHQLRPLLGCVCDAAVNHHC